MSRKIKFVVKSVAYLIIISLLLTACGTTTPEAIEVEKVVTEIVRETVVVEGTPQIVEKEVTRIVTVEETIEDPESASRILVVGSYQDVTNIDPHVGDGYSNRAIQRNLYDALMRIEGNPPEVVPHLAESVDISPDGLEYTFTLVKTATFHDGSPVTAEAVQFSLNRSLRLKKGRNWMIASVMDENSVQVVDPYTVKITLTQPFAPFLSVLPWFFIVNPELVAANAGADDGQTWLIDHEAGSGPFMIKRWEPGSLYELERYNDYWKEEGAGNLTGAIWRIIRETSSQRLALQNGDIHMAADLTGDDMDLLKGTPGLVLIEEPELRTMAIKLNTQYGPFTDINLRKAVSYAFDYEAMIEAEGGAAHAELMAGPLPPNILGGDPNLVVPRQDLDLAKEFLAKSDYPEGGLTLSYVYVTGFEIERKFGLILLDSLMELGINVELVPLVWADMVALTKEPETTPDFFPVYQSASYADPDNILYPGYHSSQNGNWSNPTYSIPEVDALIEQGRMVLDEQERAEIYHQVQLLIVEDAPDIFGVLEKRRLAMLDAVKDWEFVPLSANAIEFYPLSLK